MKHLLRADISRHLSDFSPRAVGPVLTGLVSQFLLLPLLTFCLVLTVEPAPSIALGLMLVALHGETSDRRPD